MKIRFWVTAAILLGLLILHRADLLYAQQTANTLTILYSNNINGEIDPCPT